MQNEKIPLPFKHTPMMLINDVSRMFNHIIRKTQDTYNIQASYRHILFHLAHQDGCTQLQLVNKTRMRAPTISVTLQKMEADGYVKRISDEKDMRQTLVFLTDKGKEYHEKMFKKIQEIDRRILMNISDEECDMLCDILKRMINNIIDEAGGFQHYGFCHHEENEQ